MKLIGGNKQTRQPHKTTTKYNRITNRDESICVLQFFERLLDIGALHMRKLLDTARTKEALEADNTLVQQWFQIVLVSGYDSTPESHINVNLSFGRILLDFKIFDGRCWRYRVSGNDDERKKEQFIEDLIANMLIIDGASKYD